MMAPRYTVFGEAVRASLASLRLLAEREVMCARCYRRHIRELALAYREYCERGVAGARRDGGVAA